MMQYINCTEKQGRFNLQINQSPFPLKTINIQSDTITGITQRLLGTHPQSTYDDIKTVLDGYLMLVLMQRESLSLDQVENLINEGGELNNTRITNAIKFVQFCYQNSQCIIENLSNINNMGDYWAYAEEAVLEFLLFKTEQAINQEQNERMQVKLTTALEKQQYQEILKLNQKLKQISAANRALLQANQNLKRTTKEQSTQMHNFIVNQSQKIMNLEQIANTQLWTMNGQTAQLQQKYSENQELLHIIKQLLSSRPMTSQESQNTAIFFKKRQQNDNSPENSSGDKIVKKHKSNQEQSSRKTIDLTNADNEEETHPLVQPQFNQGQSLESWEQQLQPNQVHNSCEKIEKLMKLDSEEIDKENNNEEEKNNSTDFSSQQKNSNPQIFWQQDNNSNIYQSLQYSQSYFNNAQNFTSQQQGNSKQSSSEQNYAPDTNDYDLSFSENEQDSTFLQQDKSSKKSIKNQQYRNENQPNPLNANYEQHYTNRSRTPSPSSVRSENHSNKNSRSNNSKNSSPGLPFDDHS